MLYVENIDRSKIIRLETEAENDVFFMSFSYRLHAVFICFVPNTSKRIIILGVFVAIHEWQNSSTTDNGKKFAFET